MEKLSFKGGFDEGRMRGIDRVHEIVACLIHHGLNISTREETKKIIFEIMVQKSLPSFTSYHYTTVCTVLIVLSYS